MNRVQIFLVALLTSLTIMDASIIYGRAVQANRSEAEAIYISEPETVIEIEEIIEKPMAEEEEITEPVETIEETLVLYQGPSLSQEEIDLIALVTMAEAEGEPEEGKRLVIDTILNRMDHPEFPDTASGVIYQSGQFSSMWNGRVDQCYVQEDICTLVREELAKRTNNDVIFFTANRYSKYGTPLFQVGNHCFSSY